MIERAREILKSSARIVSFSGAGLSAESGVSTFRDTSGDGLWARYDPTQLASPRGFEADPTMVMDWYAWRRRRLATVPCNPAHHALASRCDDILHITQNVDDLLERAGAPDHRIVHLHGVINRDRCHGSCGHEESIDLSDPPGLRDCPNCRASRMRPGVVWFGESLPPDAWHTAEHACTTCDCLLVIGTSAVVYPAAGLIAHAKHAGASIIIVNTEPSDASHLADVELIGTAGTIVPQLLATTCA